MAKKSLEVQRIKLGIEKFDDLVQGGLPKESILGIMGPPGVGKSIFGLHYLLEGARNKEKCVFLCLDEPESNIKRMIQGFEFADEFNKFVKKGKIVIKYFDYEEYERIYDDFLDKINEEKVDRLVIDSFNCFYDGIIDVKHESNARKMIQKAFRNLRKSNLTTVLILEKESESVLSYNIPYMVDGMISLDYLDMGTIERRLSIPKMRWTSQYKDSVDYEISKSGIILSETEEDF